jgi:alpha-L-rhamnosidase
VAQVGPCIRRQEQIQPVRILHSPTGETILDFGQNMVGWVQMRVRGPQDTTITLRHAEVLDQRRCTSICCQSLCVLWPLNVW